MKMMLLAAVAALALPTMATAQDAGQTMPPAATDTMTPQTDPAAPPATDMGTQTGTPDTTSGTMPQQQPQPMPPQSTGDATMASPTPAGNGTMTAGGYEPSTPAMSGTPAPGATVRFQPAPSPSQACPPPAPKESYPICKKGQYDGCMQASDAHGSRSKKRSRR